MGLSVLLQSSLIARLQHDLMVIENGFRRCGSKRFVVDQPRKNYSAANLLQTSPNTYSTIDLWVLVKNYSKRFYKSLLWHRQRAYFSHLSFEDLRIAATKCKGVECAQYTCSKRRGICNALRAEEITRVLSRVIYSKPLLSKNFVVSLLFTLTESNDIYNSILKGYFFSLKRVTASKQGRPAHSKYSACDCAKARPSSHGMSSQGWRQRLSTLAMLPLIRFLLRCSEIGTKFIGNEPDCEINYPHFRHPVESVALRYYRA